MNSTKNRNEIQHNKLTIHPPTTVQKHVERMTEVRPYLDAKSDKEVALLLVEILADLYVLRLKTQQVHWNVEGPLFQTVHEMTETMYENLAKEVDLIAERIRAKGYYVPASFGVYETFSVLKFEQEALAAEQMLNNMIRDHETVAKRIKDVIQLTEEKNDSATADLLISFLQRHEERIWMVKSLSGGSSQMLQATR